MASQPERRDYFHIGRITTAHGIAGELRVQLLSSDPDRLFQVKDAGLTSPDETERRSCRVKSVRHKGSLFLVRLDGCTDRDAAEALRGWFLTVPREQAMPLAENEYFVSDLIGLTVVDRFRGVIGVVREILTGQAQDLYVVEMPGQADLYFPAVKSVLLAVDLTAGQIDIKLPDGLYELYRGDDA